MARFLPNGTLDAGFNDGQLTIALGGVDQRLNDVVIDADGNVVAAGYLDNGVTRQFLVVRVTPEGEPDLEFGDGGIVLTNFDPDGPPGHADTASDLALQADGKILVAGTVIPTGGNNDFGVMRLNPNGSLDRSFGERGWVNVHVYQADMLHGMAIDRSGDIVLVGDSGIFMSDGFTVARLTTVRDPESIGVYANHTPYERRSYTFPVQGEYTIGLGVTHEGSVAGESALLVDNVRLAGGQAVYEVSLQEGEIRTGVDFGNTRITIGFTDVVDPLRFGVLMLDGPMSIEPGTPLVGIGPPPDQMRWQTTFNRNAADTTNVEQVWSGAGNALDLDGSGVRVGVWDSGKVRETHREFGTRVTVDLDGATDYSDHSTHVAGTIGAAGLFAPVGADSISRGMANQVTIDSRDFDSYLAEMAVASPSLDVSNHSYGNASGWDVVQWMIGTGAASNYDTWFDDRDAFGEDPDFGKYGAETQQLDQILYDNPHLLSVWAAGNDRGDNFQNLQGNGSYVTYRGSISNPGWVLVPGNSSSLLAPPLMDGSGGTGYDSLPTVQTAKNSLVVGAINDVTADPYDNTNVGITRFSSWGPTDDGRIKPDVVGNGSRLFSSIATTDAAYGRSSGTSMAAPNVTGTAALLIEHYQDLFNTRPQSATSKGLLIHNAFDAGRVGPDYVYGWGVVDAAAAAGFLTAAATEENPSNFFYEHTYTGPETLTIEATGGPLKVTIVWTDPAGTAQPHDQLDLNTSVLVNDLDLRVTRSTSTFWPWTLNPANPGAAAVRTAANHVDNVEQVLIDETSAGGAYTIQIGHSGELFTQNYSLLVSGATLAGKSDLWVDDTPYSAGLFAYDTGQEPDPGMTGHPFYSSRAIWVRNDANLPGGGGYHFHQNPQVGQDNEVYVRVRNIGSAPALNAKVEVYWANSSTAPAWGPGSQWNLIDAAPLPYLAAGSSTTVSLTWQPPASATGLIGYSLIARIVSAQDPMQTAEGSDVQANTRMNNNIAWLSVMDVNLLNRLTVRAAFYPHNRLRDGPTFVDMRFYRVASDDGKAGAKQDSSPQEDGLLLVVDLGETAFGRWQDSGAAGENIEVFGGYQVQLLDLTPRARQATMQSIRSATALTRSSPAIARQTR